MKLVFCVLRFVFVACQTAKVPNIAATHDTNTFGGRLMIVIQACIAFCFCCLPKLPNIAATHDMDTLGDS